MYARNANILDVIMQRDVSASVVQAINRIHCRRVIDTEGRCEKSDVYIVLPKDWRGDAVSEDICTNMPGIKVVPWDFEPDGPRVYAARSGSTAEGVIGLMQDRKPGLVSLSYIQSELDLSKRERRRLQGDLAKPTTRLIEDADGIAKQINDLSGRPVAVAHHTKHKAGTADLFNSDVLVICHQAFLNAAKGFSVQDRGRRSQRHSVPTTSSSTLGTGGR